MWFTSTVAGQAEDGVDAKAGDGAGVFL